MPKPLSDWYDASEWRNVPLGENEAFEFQDSVGKSIFVLDTDRGYDWENTIPSGWQTPPTRFRKVELDPPRASDCTGH